MNIHTYDFVCMFYDDKLYLFKAEGRGYFKTS